MRLACGHEGLLDADMDLGSRPVPEPAAAALRELLWLGHLGQAERLAVEATYDVLAAARAGDLDVVQPHAAPTWATAKIRRNGSTTPYSRSG